MIQIIIEIQEVKEEPKKVLNVLLKTKKTDDTPLERGMEDRILPAVKHLLKDSGTLGDRAT